MSRGGGVVNSALRLHFDVSSGLRELLGGPQPVPPSVPVPPAPEAGLFAHRSLSWERLTGLGSAIGSSAFAAYALLSAAPSLSKERLAALAGDRAAVLQAYLSDYGARHPDLTLPLSADDIAYLLETEEWDGLPFPVPRVVLWQALLPGTTAPSLADAATQDELAFWWTTEGSLVLGVEDCLVPPAWRELLRRPLNDGSTVLRQRLEATIPYLRSEPGRFAGWLALALCREPGLAQYFDRGFILGLFSERSEHAALPDEEGQSSASIKKLRERFEAAAARRGFDIDLWRFVTRDAEGNRRFGVIPVAAPAILARSADVKIVGPVRQRSGLAHAARMSIETLRRAGVTVSVENVDYGFPSPGDEALMDDLGSQGDARAVLFHLNPNMLPLIVARQHGAYPKRRAAYIFWELDRPALSDFLGLDLVEDIWAASTFVQRTFQPFHEGAVECVGLAMEPPPAIDRGEARARLRAELGVPPDTTVFLSVFDGLSYIERKNPLAAIRAFQEAFPDRADMVLLLKTHNRPQGYAGPQGAAWQAVDEACRRDGRIRLLTSSMPHRDILGMIRGADAYVSLHRSEGWGLGPAEAMALETPVIVTAYGGTEDFCDDTTAWRVAWSRRPVASTDYIHVDPSHGWAEPDHAASVAAFRDILAEPARRAARVTAARQRISDTMSFQSVGQRYVRALERLLTRS